MDPTASGWRSSSGSGRSPPPRRRGSPWLSLPNMLVIASVLGWRKTSVYVALVVVMATASGLLYGTLFV